MKRRIALIGPPASGKGTQAELIKVRFQLPVTSPGAMLREEKRRGTTLGIEADRLTSQGNLVPDEMVVTVIDRWMDQHGDAFVFDGFPRSVGQARALDELLSRRNLDLQAVLALETNLETLQARVAARMVCEDCGSIVSTGLHVRHAEAPCPQCGGRLVRRSDDTAEVLARRMEEYLEKSEPVVGFYEERGLLHRVESSAPPALVFAQITAILEAE